VQEGKLAHTSFPHGGMMLFEMRSACARGKARHTSFPPQWDDVVRDALLLVQEGKLANTSFPPRWDDVVRDASCLCKRES
jgi:hypothetical protein